MIDLTIIYLTLNKMSASWTDFHMKHLLKAIGNYPVVSISRKAIDFGTNLIQTGEGSSYNANKCILCGAIIADTPYIGIAEDDTLYTREHFTEFRPSLTAVAFDRSRWSVFAWASNPIYNMKQRHGTFAMIAPRELAIEAYSERMEKWPNGYPDARGGEIGRLTVERRLQLTHRDAIDYYSWNPIVNVCHRRGLSHTKKPGLRMRLGQMRAYDIPYWGKAVDIVNKFNG